MKRDVEALELEKNADMGVEWSILVLRVDMEAEKAITHQKERITDP